MGRWSRIHVVVFGREAVGFAVRLIHLRLSPNVGALSEAHMHSPPYGVGTTM